MAGNLTGMKICDPKCEFLKNAYCDLHSEELNFAVDLQGLEFIYEGKIVFLRCPSCKIEKEELQIIEDLKELNDAYKRISDIAKDERFEQLLNDAKRR